MLKNVNANILKAVAKMQERVSIISVKKMA